MTVNTPQVERFEVDLFINNGKEVFRIYPINGNEPAINRNFEDREIAERCASYMNANS